LIARLWRWDAERLRADASADYLDRLASGDENPDYSVSVWGVPKPGDKDVETLMRDLCEYVRQVRDARWVAFTTDRRLRDKGFPLRASGPPRHYDVVLGTDLAQADVDGLAGVFSEHERRRFPACTK
jgi:hypothetical protein